LSGPVALLVGNEGSGLSKDVLAEADEIVAIPQSPRVESLNAGIAASIILYEAARQRISSPPRHRGTED
jgi:TrmH family RNA methyltransferase